MSYGDNVSVSVQVSENFNTNADNKDEWLTPPEIIKVLGEFDLDPCSPHPNKRPWDTAKRHFHKEMNGLNQLWSGRVWCNPPYGKETFKWLEKLHDHGNGIALIFARTDTHGFHEQVWNKADAMFFLRGRLSFYKIEGNSTILPRQKSGAPSCLVAYGANNLQSLKNCKLKGKFVNLKQ